MATAGDVLGMNARQKMYVSLNLRSAKRYANSKLALKRLMKEKGMLVPETYAKFTTMEQVRAFEFTKIETSFVVKPATGSGGRGILIVRKRGEENKVVFVGGDGRTLSEDDIRLHIADILEGQYSTFGTKHMAFVEEWVGVHPKFKRYTYKGTPDVRVIVYNSVPVMAMLRLPTEESDGRANLHQGAIGVGVDIATGITLKGVYHGKPMRLLPGTKRKLNGIIIPDWTVLLKTAVQAVGDAGLAYCGVDLFVHKEKGPMVVELNAMPGLSIQLANDGGLRRRLERVEGLRIRDVAHGVRVGKALFAEMFADRVKADEGVTIVENFETVKVRSAQKKLVEVEAMVDTGAFRSAIDRKLAEDLGLMEEDNVLWEKGYASTLGRERRKVIEVIYYLKGKKIKAAVSVANRAARRTKILIGRLDLQGFMVNPQLRSR